MAETAIEWTEHTWNPLAGCSVLTAGCKRCYAMKLAGRLEAMGQERYVGLTQKTKAGFVWTGKVRFVEEALGAPLRRRRPTVWFVNSMSDLFHEDVPDEWIDRVFAVMALAPQHTFQCLTKRSDRMQVYCSSPNVTQRIAQAMDALAVDMEHDPVERWAPMWPDAITWPLPNVWLGVSAEDQENADVRIGALVETPAAVRFVSFEPLLGPIDTFDPRINWAIIGGESGPGARPFDLRWAYRLLHIGGAAGVRMFVKQLGANPMLNGEGIYLKDRKGGDQSEWPVGLQVREMPERLAA